VTKNKKRKNHHPKGHKLWDYKSPHEYISKKRIGQQTTYKEVNDVARAIFETIKELTIEQENGVVVDGIGYFGVMQYERKPRPVDIVKGRPKYNWVITFSPVLNNGIFFRHAVFEAKPTVRKEMKKYANRGMQYKNNYKIVKENKNGKSRFYYT